MDSSLLLFTSANISRLDLIFFLGIFAFVKINWNKLDNGLWDSELDVYTRKLQQFYNCKKLQYIKSVVVPNTTGINYRMKCSINVLPDAIVVCLHNEF